MMKWTIQALAIVVGVLFHDHVSSFHTPALISRRRRHRPMPLRMVEEQQKKPQSSQGSSSNSWLNSFAGWFSPSGGKDEIDDIKRDDSLSRRNNNGEQPLVYAQSTTYDDDEVALNASVLVVDDDELALSSSVLVLEEKQGNPGGDKNTTANEGTNRTTFVSEREEEEDDEMWDSVTGDKAEERKHGRAKDNAAVTFNNNVATSEDSEKEKEKWSAVTGDATKAESETVDDDPLYLEKKQGNFNDNRTASVKEDNTNSMPKVSKKEAEKWEPVTVAKSTTLDDDELGLNASLDLEKKHGNANDTALKDNKSTSEKSKNEKWDAVTTDTPKAGSETFDDEPSPLFLEKQGKIKDNTTIFEKEGVVTSQEVSEKEEKWDSVTEDKTKAAKTEEESQDWAADNVVKAGKDGAPVIGGHNIETATDMPEAGRVGQDHMPPYMQQFDSISNDKIADGMKQAGDTETTDWVGRDTTVAGEAADPTAKPFLDDKLGKALKREHEKNYDEIADSMKQAGDTETTDWVGRDMTVAGEAEDQTRKPFFDDKVGKALNREHEKDYDKIADSMKQAGDTETTNWVVRDMNVTGKAEDPTTKPFFDDKVGKALNREHEKNYDKIAESMKQAGDTETTDWVVRDMDVTGKAEDQTTKPFFDDKLGKALNRENKKNYDKIADSMKQAGDTETIDWVVKDMRVAGKAEDPTTRPFFDDKLGKALNREHEKNYDDIYNDLAKAGKQGSEGSSSIRQAMENTGRADYFTEKTASSIKDGSYKFVMEKSAYDIDWIRKDMEEAGRSQSSAAAAADVAFFGQDRSFDGNPIGSQEQQITERLSSKHLKDTTAPDGVSEGSAMPGTRRTTSTSTKGLNAMLADDMIKAGKDSGSDWVARDMENAGHGESSLDKISAATAKNPSYQQQEKEDEFFKTKNIKVDDTPVELTLDSIEEDDLFFHSDVEGEPGDGESDAEEKQGRARLPVRVLKKAVMPWKKWEDI